MFLPLLYSVQQIMKDCKTSVCHSWSLQMNRGDLSVKHLKEVILLNGNVSHNISFSPVYALCTVLAINLTANTGPSAFCPSEWFNVL